MFLTVLFSIHLGANHLVIWVDDKYTRFHRRRTKWQRINVTWSLVPNGKRPRVVTTLEYVVIGVVRIKSNKWALKNAVDYNIFPLVLNTTYTMFKHTYFVFEVDIHNVI